MENLSAQPHVRRFTVRRLHGYKDIGLDLRTAAKVVIAENGSGKTTLLNILHAFLTCRMSRLAPVNFHSIECEFADGREIQLRKQDIDVSTEAQVPASMRATIDGAGIDVNELAEWAASADFERSIADIRAHPLSERLYRSSPMDVSQTRTFLKNFSQHVGALYSDKARDAIKNIKEKLGALQILYLPTYRRIETALARSADPARSFSDAFLARYYESTASVYRVPATRSTQPADTGAPQMFFGLTDVEQRLKDITEEIGRRSNQGYRTTSATILDDLLTGRELTPSDAPLPDMAALELFFSRIAIAPSRRASPLEALKHLYESGRIKDPSNQLLRYFLQRLGSVVDQTRDIERRLEQFVQVVNVYLLKSSDEKEFRYDPQTTRVTVKSKWTDQEIRLDDLSSGEKQVISLFARLYLETNRTFVLIDEPELSLSIDWQRHLLPDVARAASCSQLLAITHSPFIFENELDPYAGPLQIDRHKLN